MSIDGIGDELSLPRLGDRILILGGARSGKSRIAESLIERAGDGIYLATAEAFDDEMTERIVAHKSRRGENWKTFEEPLEIAHVIDGLAASGNDRPVLVDCLTLWLSNLLHANRDIDREVDTLLTAVEAVRFTTILVSNEVGAGIVPENALARQFRDHAGIINQAVAARADTVIYVVAGIPQRIK